MTFRIWLLNYSGEGNNMNDTCSNAHDTCALGSHRLSPIEFKVTETIYVCLDCGDTITEYQDHGGC